MKTLPQRLAFTLVELLTVMGVMALLAGGLGLSMQGGGTGLALESAQGVVASVLGDARSKATQDRARTMLVVEADPTKDEFLRGLHVAVEDEPDSGQWRIGPEATLLAPGVFIVPGNGNMPGVTFPLAADGGSAWPPLRRSSLVVLSPESIVVPAGRPTGVYLGMVVPLDNQGRAGTGGGDKLIVGVGRRSAMGVTFANAEQVRGIAISSYGVAIPINDGPGFDF